MFRAAADTISLPEPKPRAIFLLLIVSSSRSREVTRAQRSRVWRGEDVLQSLDFSDGLFGVHWHQ
jgi:hypothetical protein